MAVLPSTTEQFSRARPITKPAWKTKGEIEKMMAEFEVDSLDVDIEKIARVDVTTYLFPFYLNRENRNKISLYNKNGLLIGELNINPYSLLRALEFRGIFLTPNGNCGVGDGSKALYQSWLVKNN